MAQKPGTKPQKFFKAYRSIFTHLDRFAPRLRSNGKVQPERRARVAHVRPGGKSTVTIRSPGLRNIAHFQALRGLCCSLYRSLSRTEIALPIANGGFDKGAGL